MKVGNREFSGKGAREEAGNALNAVVMSWRDDKTAQVRGPLQRLRDPEPGQSLQRRRAGSVHPGQGDLQGQSQSRESAGHDAEHRARPARRLTAGPRRSSDEIERQEKALADYRAQLGRPFEHEARLKELLAKQAQLNAALDLDKHERR